MTRNAKGALALIILGLVALLSAYYLLEKLTREEQVASSDAAQSKGVIKIGMDNFTGYFPLCSPRLKQLLLVDGYRLECVDDQANYPARFADLADGSLDFAVGTVDAYLLNGRKNNYPGVIVAVLDESKGADAIVARSSVVSSIGELKGKSDIKVAFTPNSPSHHFLKVAGVHFDIDFLKDSGGNWRSETDGSSAALKQLLGNQVDVATLWEPDVSKALATPGIVKILGSEETRRLIVDVLIASHRTEADRPELGQILLANYFRSLKFYRDNNAEFDKQLAMYAGVSTSQSKALRGGIHWVTMQENASEWMGVSNSGRAPQHGLYETIDSTLDIQRDVGDFSGNPLPGGDPRRVMSSRTIGALFSRGISSSFAGSRSFQTGSPDTALKEFAALPADGWDRLRDVGSLKVRPIQFEAGTGKLTRTGKEQIDVAAKVLKSYPNFRIVIEGHTSSRGDDAVNKTLSQERAAAVRRYLHVTYKIDKDRLRALGYGSDRPLARTQGESSRAYRSRLPRVELKLVSEVY